MILIFLEQHHYYAICPNNPLDWALEVPKWLLGAKNSLHWQDECVVAMLEHTDYQDIR